MHLIIGGAYQGKLEYAMRRFELKTEEIFYCSEQAEVDTSKKCIYGFEKYIRACCREKKTPIDNLPKGTVIICQDIFCGIVPVDREERAWREMAGTLITALAVRADTATRIFCGLAEKLK